MNNANNTQGLKVKTRIKAGGLTFQHNRRLASIKVRSAMKAGGLTPQHNRRLASLC